MATGNEPLAGHQLVDKLIDSQLEWRQLIRAANPSLSLDEQLTELQIKRQEVIHELVQTERHHCLTLALMRQVYLSGLRELNESRMGQQQPPPQCQQPTSCTKAGPLNLGLSSLNLSLTKSLRSLNGPQPADQPPSIGQLDGHSAGELIDLERLFPALEDLIQAHELFFAHLRLLLVDSCRPREVDASERIVGLVGPVGELLGEQFRLQRPASQRNAPARAKQQPPANGQKLLQAYTKFCGSHSDANRYYKQLMAHDKGFKQFIEHCNKQHTSCRQRGIPECNLLVTQRLTKYPLLIEQLIKTSKGEPQDEELKLRGALAECKSLLAELNDQLARREAFQRLLDIYAQFSPKSYTIYNRHLKFTKHDLLQHQRLRQLCHWDPQVRVFSASRRKLFPILCLILDDIVVFLRVESSSSPISSAGQPSGTPPAELSGGAPDSLPLQETTSHMASSLLSLALETQPPGSGGGYNQQTGPCGVHSPRYYFANVDNKPSVISLSKLLVREKAAADQEPRVYLISSSPRQPEMYELAFVSRRHQVSFVDKLKACIEQHNKSLQQDQPPTGSTGDLLMMHEQLGILEPADSCLCCSGFGQEHGAQATCCLHCSDETLPLQAPDESHDEQDHSNEHDNDYDDDEILRQYGADDDEDQDDESPELDSDAKQLSEGIGSLTIAEGRYCRECQPPETQRPSLVSETTDIELDIEQDVMPEPPTFASRDSCVGEACVKRRASEGVAEAVLSERAKDSLDEGAPSKQKLRAGNRRRRVQRPRNVSNQSSSSSEAAHRQAIGKLISAGEAASPAQGPTPGTQYEGESDSGRGHDCSSSSSSSAGSDSSRAAAAPLDSPQSDMYPNGGQIVRELKVSCAEQDAESSLLRSSCMSPPPPDARHRGAASFCLEHPKQRKLSSCSSGSHSRLVPIVSNARWASGCGYCPSSASVLSCRRALAFGKEARERLRRNSFVPEQKLEELRDLRIQLDKDKQEWQEKFDRMQEQLLNERRELDLAREQLKLDRQQVAGERDQLQRKLAALKERGLLASPLHKVMIRTPELRLYQTQGISHRQNQTGPSTKPFVRDNLASSVQISSGGQRHAQQTNYNQQQQVFSLNQSVAFMGGGQQRISSYHQQGGGQNQSLVSLNLVVNEPTVVSKRLNGNKLPLHLSEGCGPQAQQHHHSSLVSHQPLINSLPKSSSSDRRQHQLMCDLRSQQHQHQQQHVSLISKVSLGGTSMLAERLCSSSPSASRFLALNLEPDAI